jgi:hypothetical protein
VHGTTEIFLKINGKSNPIVQQIELKYGRNWSSTRLFRRLSNIARPRYEMLLSKEASQLSPFPIKLNHIFQQASTSLKGSVNVNLEMGSNTLSELHHRLQLKIDEAYQTSWKPPRFKGLPDSMRWIPNKKAANLLNIINNITQTQADDIMTDLRGLCQNGAGEIMAEGFLIQEQRDRKLSEPGLPSGFNKREFLFTGHLEK